jgi:universal stress protein A
MMAIERILVPTDFSAPSLKALDEALEFNQPYRAEIILVYAVEHSYYESPVSVPNFGRMLEDEVRASEEKLGEVCASVVARGVKCRATVELGVPFQAICDAAEKVNASLIIMATHGRTGLAHVLVGSVAERVVQHAGCPILLLRSTPAAAKPKAKA